jgi:hypothetical protein
LQGYIFFHPDNGSYKHTMNKKMFPPGKHIRKVWTSGIIVVYLTDLRNVQNIYTSMWFFSLIYSKGTNRVLLKNKFNSRNFCLKILFCETTINLGYLMKRKEAKNPRIKLWRENMLIITEILEEMVSICSFFTKLSFNLYWYKEKVWLCRLRVTQWE